MTILIIIIFFADFYITVIITESQCLFRILIITQHDRTAISGFVSALITNADNGSSKAINNTMNFFIKINF